CCPTIRLGYSGPGLNLSAGCDFLPGAAEGEAADDGEQRCLEDDDAADQFEAVAEFAGPGGRAQKSGRQRDQAQYQRDENGVVEPGPLTGGPDVGCPFHLQVA